MCDDRCPVRLALQHELASVASEPVTTAATLDTLTHFVRDAATRLRAIPSTLYDIDDATRIDIEDAIEAALMDVGRRLIRLERRRATRARH